MSVDGSTTGVEVEPMSGARSPQLMVEARTGFPKCRFHSTLPVVALIP